MSYRAIRFKECYIDLTLRKASQQGQGQTQNLKCIVFKVTVFFIYLYLHVKGISLNDTEFSLLKHQCQCLQFIFLIYIPVNIGFNEFQKCLSRTNSNDGQPGNHNYRQ